MKMLGAVVQMTSGGDVAANLARAGELVAEAARRGAELAVLPENFALLAEHESAKLGVAEAVPSPSAQGGSPGDGPILSAMREAARRHKIALVLGGMPERTARATHVHNTCVYVDARGEIGAVYRKIHLFDVAIPDGATYRESASVEPGGLPVVAATPWGGLGLSVCYDVRFPELYRDLVARSARMLVVPAAFTLHTGRDHWHVLLRARAVENLAFVLAAAQYGRHNPKRVTYGHSCIIDPWGHVLAEVGDHEGVAVAELDFAYQAPGTHASPDVDIDALTIRPYVFRMAVAVQRITANLPEKLLHDAREVTGKGITETIIEGLELVRRRKALMMLERLRGKLHIDINIDELRGRGKYARRP
jgi:deaminated glutathione amidase